MSVSKIGTTRAYSTAVVPLSFRKMLMLQSVCSRSECDTFIGIFTASPSHGIKVDVKVKPTFVVTYFAVGSCVVLQPVTPFIVGAATVTGAGKVTQTTPVDCPFAQLAGAVP